MELLDAASAEELRMFVLRQAEENVLYKSALLQWLSSTYTASRQRSDSFKLRVRHLFCQVREVEPYYHYYDGALIVIDWKSVDAGMLELVDELRAALEAGEVRGVPEAVTEFFRLVNDHAEELPEYDYLMLRKSHDACAELLNTYQALPGIPEKDKLKLLTEVQDIARLRVYRKSMLYTMSRLVISLTALGLPAHEAYRRIDSMKLQDYERWFADYHKIRLLYTLGRDAAAQNLIRRNITCDFIVDEEVERLIGAGKLCDAMALAEGAIEADVPGRHKALLRKAHIAELMHDMPTIQDAYKQIVILGNSSLDTYHKLKALTPTEEWPKLYGEIAEALQDSVCYSYLADIFAEEEDCERLFNLLMNDDIYDQYNLIHEHLPQLPEMYHEPLLQICLTTLWRRAPMLKGRRLYAEYAEDVKRFSQLPGARPYVDELLSRVRTHYARRSALQDELSRVVNAPPSPPSGTN